MMALGLDVNGIRQTFADASVKSTSVSLAALPCRHCCDKHAQQTAF